MSARRGLSMDMHAGRREMRDESAREYILPWLAELGRILPARRCVTTGPRSRLPRRRARGLGGEIPGPATADHAGAVRDLRDLLWASSIDNDDSRDLDQLTVAEPLRRRRASRSSSRSPTSTRSSRRARALDAPRADQHDLGLHGRRRSSRCCRSELSTDLTSLGRGPGAAGDRRRDGRRRRRRVDGVGRLPRARPQPGQARLRRASPPGWRARPRAAAVAAVPGLDEQLRLQDRVAQALQARAPRARRPRARDARAAAVFDGRRACRPAAGRSKNRAKELIEDFMIAANGVSARFLEASGLPVAAARGPRRPSAGTGSSQLAAELGERLPADARRCRAGRVPRQAPRRPTRCASPTCRSRSSSSWAPANTCVERPGEAPRATSGWPCSDYTHSTAPEPALPGPRHPAAAEGGARRPPARPTPTPSSTALARTARTRRTRRTRWSARSASRRRRCCSPAGSASGSTPS